MSSRNRLKNRLSRGSTALATAVALTAAAILNGGCATSVRRPAPAPADGADGSAIEAVRKEINTEVDDLQLGSPVPDFKSVPLVDAAAPSDAPLPLRHLSRLAANAGDLSPGADSPLIFDIPIAYNERVKKWLTYYQTTGRTSFKRWLERSARFLPIISGELQDAGLPQDLAYVAMVESGFQPEARSGARAVGLWQFIAQTGQRYGLHVSWWIDERRDFQKSTRAAIGYMGDLYRMFGSWYLVAASYNMGESGVARLMKRYRTNDFWQLADAGALPDETKNYVPKILAATLISKAPALYGFRDLDYLLPHSFDWFLAPAGTDLSNLASYLGVSAQHMQELNPELLQGYIPREVREHRIRVPKGATLAATHFAQALGPALTLRD